MSNSVKFKSNNKGYFEIRERCEDDFKIKPEIFKNDLDDNAKLVLLDPYGMLFIDGNVDKKPLYYMRHALINENRFGGVINLGDTFLDYQISGDTKSFFQRGPIDHIYTKLDDENGEFVYGSGTDNPYSCFRYYKDHARWVEGDVLDLNAKHIGKTIIDHQAAFSNLPEIFNACLIEGVYKGQKVKGLGQWARNYQLSSKNENILSNLGYITLDMSGIREDDTFERCFVAIDQTGSVGAFYYRDNCEFITSNEVEFEADWYRLPYVDDGTCVFGDATIRFKDKVFHFKAKWGTKGVTEKPRLEKHGQSHVLGTWYEGEKEYKHKIFFTFSENMEAYDYKLEKMGFKVI